MTEPQSSRRHSRLGFRSRLTLMITGVFVAAGAVLLVVQNLIVRGLFDQAIDQTVQCVSTGDDQGGVVETCAVTSGPPPLPTLAAGGEDAIVRQASALDAAVSGGLVLWSIVVLAIFAVVAAALAYWLSRRAMRRIADVTAAANEISERDLGRRLDLPGPDDEIKELGDTIDRMLDRLQLAFAAQDRFVANASHELRTPLTTVRTSLEIPLTQGTVPDDLQPAIRRALRANERSERLIAALLTLARGRTGETETEPVELGEVARAQIADLVEFAATREVEVALRVDGPAIVVGDRVLLEHAVRNLIDNAIRHNRPGGEVRVRVTASRDGVAGALVEVENTGAVLSAAEVALLAEPFHRGAESRTSAGESIGLGLAIVTGIAAAHGGTLELSPRTPDGLVARLRLPSSD